MAGSPARGINPASQPIGSPGPAPAAADIKSGDGAKVLADQLKASAYASASFASQVAVLIGAVGKNTAALITESRFGRAMSQPGAARLRAAGQGAGSGLQAVGGMLAGVLSKVAGPVMLALAPITALASLLGEATSGFGMFMKTMKLVTMLVSSLFMPVFVVLSAYVLAASDVIKEKMIPVVKRIAEVLDRVFLGGGKKKKADPHEGMEFDQGTDTWKPKPGAKPAPLPGFPGAPAERETFAAGLGDLVLPKPTPPQPPLFPAPAGKFPGFPGTPDGDRLNRENAPKQGASADKSFDDRLKESKELILAEVQRMGAPPAQMTSIAGAWKDALMAGLRESPLDRKMRENTQEIVKAIVEGFRQANPITY